MDKINFKEKPFNSSPCNSYHLKSELDTILNNKQELNREMQERLKKKKNTNVNMGGGRGATKRFLTINRGLSSSSLILVIVGWNE